MEYQFNKYLNEYECTLRGNIKLYINKYGRLRYNDIPKDVTIDELLDIYYTTLNIVEECRLKDIEKSEAHISDICKQVQEETTEKLYKKIRSYILDALYLIIVVNLVLFIALDYMWIIVPITIFVAIVFFILLRLINKTGNKRQ